MGGLYKAEIIESNNKLCSVKTVDIVRNYGKRNFKIHIAVAPTKNINRFEWLLEKATEIGIDEITPVICKHSERKSFRYDRLVKVITSALKQSCRAYHPKLNDMIKFGDLISLPFNEQKFIAHYTDVPAGHLIKKYNKGSNCLILIGTEGDFSSKELEVAKEEGFQSVSFGNHRLRTETAAFAACHVINLLNE